MEKRTLLSVVGARPNFVKVAPVCWYHKRHSDSFDHILVHTGQHYDASLSGDFFDILNIPSPDINLGIGSGSYSHQVGTAMQKLEAVFKELKPDTVLVYGDINSTVAAALAARAAGVEIAHVEAGLRSFDMGMPEEVNRKVTDSVADLLFAHSDDAVQNLLREGHGQDRVFLVGNIMIDTLMNILPGIDEGTALEGNGLAAGGYIYLTLHRPENVDKKDQLTAIVRRLEEIAEGRPVFFPVHPRTRARLKEFGLERDMAGIKGLTLAEPVDYFTSLALMKNASAVITDSGGVQEETTFLKVPCLTLRANTERPVTVTRGTNRLTNIETLVEDAAAGTTLMDRSAPPRWDGKTTERIMERLLQASP